MKNMNRIRQISLTILCLLSIVHAQNIQIVFHSFNPYFFTNDQLWNYSIVNMSTSSVSAQIELAVYKEGSILIYQAKTSPIKLLPGENPGQLFSAKAIQSNYSSDASATFYKNTGLLAAGNYSFCIGLQSAQNSNIGYSCQEINVNAITPPILTNPYNKEEISTTMPLLNWIPVMPQGIPELKYLLQLWEIKSSVIVGEPLVALKTTGNSLQYNAGLPPLKEGSQYRWQVTAFAGNYYLGKSQIWDFSINQNSPSSPSPGPDEDSTDETTSTDTDSYRIIGDETVGADYVANGYLKIAYNNVANDTTLPYKISLADNPDVFLSNLPVQTLSNGINRINLNLAVTNLFENNETYTLEIEDGNGRGYYLDFLYINP